jgi:hypothetical protein
MALSFHGIGRLGSAGAPRTEWPNASRYSEMSANLLIELRSNFCIFSEYALKNKANHLDFDSAIPRFESWRPSQQILGSVPGTWVTFYT